MNRERRVWKREQDSGVPAVDVVKATREFQLFGIVGTFYAYRKDEKWNVLETITGLRVFLGQKRRSLRNTMFDAELYLKDTHHTSDIPKYVKSAINSGLTVRPRVTGRLILLPVEYYRNR